MTLSILIRIETMLPLAAPLLRQLLTSQLRPGRLPQIASTTINALKLTDDRTLSYLHFMTNTTKQAWSCGGSFLQNMT